MNVRGIPLIIITFFYVWLLASEARTTNVPQVSAKETEPVLVDERILRSCPVSKGFDFPVGAPDGEGYYNAQRFGKNNHLGDDWNGTGGGNTDLKDPIYSVADGVCHYAKNLGFGWGKVVRILHNTGTVKEPVYIESLYAHLYDMRVKTGDVVRKGQVIGRMGNCKGRYFAHLHFEIRTRPGLFIGSGYGISLAGHIDPTLFIKRNREITR